MKNIFKNILYTLTIVLFIVSPVSAIGLDPNACGTNCIGRCHEDGFGDSRGISNCPYTNNGKTRPDNQTDSLYELYVAAAIFGVSTIITYLIVKAKKPRGK